jgi:SynChlorMet cassette protein ScmC
MLLHERLRVNTLSHEALKNIRDGGGHCGAGKTWSRTGEFRIVDCYRLNLAGAMSMDLVTTAKSDAWIQKVARIMHLEGVSHRKTARLQCRTSGLECPGKRYGVLTIYSDGNGTHLVSDVRAEMPRELTVREVWQSFYPFYRHLVEVGGLPLHAALLRREARCVLLAARAGAGKSTCCRRLPPGWEPICDEEVVLVPFTDGTWHVYPFPTWSDIVERKLDRTWHVQRNYPLSAMFFLERGEIDSAEPAGEGEAVIYLSRRAREKCFFYDWGLERHEALGFRQKLFENVCSVAATLPAFKLVVSREGRFWEEMGKVLNV